MLNLNLKYKAVLLDFDGTMFDTWPGVLLALQKTHQQYTDSNNPFINLSVEFSHLKRTELLVKILGQTPSEEQENFFVNTYKSILAENLLPYAGLHELINFFNQHAIQWGIVTNKSKDYFSTLFEKVPLLKSVACLVCPEDVENKKPSPEPLIKACSILGLYPNEVIYVGDSLLDLISANACKIDFALSAYGYIKKNEINFYRQHIAYTINQLNDIIKIISCNDR